MSRRLRLTAASAAVALIATLAACGSSDDDASDASTPATDDSVTDISLVPATQPSVPDVVLPEGTPTELVTTVITEGTGEPAVEGDTVLVQYVGVRSEDGTQFDTNYGSDPLSVTLGSGGVIAGWDEGLVGTTAGERLQLDIPSEMAYGEEPRGEIIQAGDALSFVIDVLAVAPAVDPATAVTQAEVPTSAEMATAVETDDVRAGDGAALEEGMTGLFHLVAARRDDGTILQSTWDAMQPQPLTVTSDGLVAGLAEGLVGMQVGGRRTIVLPYDAASGLTPETDVVIVADLLAAY
jgi:peptidylprolyl isomerase